MSLPDEDVDHPDAYAQHRRPQSWSAALQKAVRLLRASELRAAYEDAWTEWSGSEDAHLWDAAATDGPPGRVSLGR